MSKRSDYSWVASLVSLYFLSKAELIQAQITSDGTLSTQVETTNNLDFTINNGNRVGSNLFHSFREFSVPTGGSASFTNDLDVKNIISRVTGASISNIDGLLKTNGIANLFLINPNGILFGSNASLNVGGSFVTSTASHLLFADGTQFSATNPETPALLTVSVPVGLQFGQTVKPIQIQGATLQIPPGNTLAILGGDVLVKGGNLKATAGRIELGSVAGDSFVNLIPITEGFALGYENVPNFQDIEVSKTAWIRTTGEGNGAIQMRGRRIAISESSKVGGNTSGEKAGQPLRLIASESVEVSDSKLITVTTGTGVASDIIIDTKRFIVKAATEFATIETLTGSSGPGGNLTVNASESVEVVARNGFFARLSARTFGLEKDAGNAGKVQISTGRLILRDGGHITTSTVGEGRGGSLTVNATESVEVSGRSVVKGIDFPSGLLAESRKAGDATITGKGGNLIVNTGRLVVQDGGSISVAAINGSAGQAGILDINASDSVTVSGTGIDRNNLVVPSSLLARSEGSGSAGNLRIHTGSLTVQHQAEVSVNSTGGGIAGNLEITANQLMLDDRGKLSAETTGGKGNINLRFRNSILRRGSQITTNATGSNITGGNISIDTDVLTALENSDISANSSEFRGGNIRINASGIFGTQFRQGYPDTSESDIAASGKDSSLNGSIQINTPDLAPTSGLIELPANIIDSTRLIARGCPASKGNSFTVSGRGGLPPLPSEPLRPYNTVSIDWVTGDASSSSLSELQRQIQNTEIVRQKTISPTTNYRLPTPEKNTEIVEATGWVTNNEGRVVLIAATPTVTIDNSSFPPRSCP